MTTHTETVRRNGPRTMLLTGAAILAIALPVGAYLGGGTEADSAGTNRSSAVVGASAGYLNAFQARAAAAPEVGAVRAAIEEAEVGAANMGYAEAFGGVRTAPWTGGYADAFASRGEK